MDMKHTVTVLMGRRAENLNMHKTRCRPDGI